MKYISRIAFALFLLTFVGVASVSHAKGLKGVVKLKGEYAPCEIIKLLDMKGVSPCTGAQDRKKVVVVVGDVPNYDKGTTVIIKFKGKERVKGVGKIRCHEMGLMVPATIKKCVNKDEYIIWLDQDQKGHVVIETERGLFEKVHQGDKALLKARVKRAVVEGC